MCSPEDIPDAFPGSRYVRRSSRCTHWEPFPAPARPVSAVPQNPGWKCLGLPEQLPQPCEQKNLVLKEEERYHSVTDGFHMIFSSAPTEVPDTSFEGASWHHRHMQADRILQAPRPTSDNDSQFPPAIQIKNSNEPSRFTLFRWTMEKEMMNAMASPFHCFKRAK